MKALDNYQSEIQSVAAYAKAINFDVANGDMVELVRGWLKRTQRMSYDIENNIEDVFRLLKAKLA